MDELKAAELAGILSASYPGRQIGEANLAAWTAEFVAMDEDVATTVAGKLKYRTNDPPSLAQIAECHREVTQQTFSPTIEPPVLMGRSEESITFGEWLRRNPQMKETARRVFPSFFKQPSDGETLPAEDLVRRDLA